MDNYNNLDELKDTIKSLMKLEILTVKDNMDSEIDTLLKDHDSLMMRHVDKINNCIESSTNADHIRCTVNMIENFNKIWAPKTICIGKILSNYLNRKVINHKITQEYEKLDDDIIFN